jgi:hypothetical protein
MSQTFKCPWCKKEIAKAAGVERQSFILSFEVGTWSHDPGYSTATGYEIEDMCTDCAWKLKDKLIELGIKIEEIDV